jgi:hypothetical protein
MAIPFLNHLDLRSVSELRNAILHLTTESSTSDVEGKIIYDTGSDTIKFYNGNEWISLGGDTVRTVSVDTNGDGTANSTLESSETLTLKKGSNITLSEADGVVTISSTDTNTTYSAMTTTTLGLGKIRYATGSTPAAEAQSTTANRTYGVTKNSSNQLVVNVPWVDTDNNTQRAAGTGLSLDGNTINANVDGTNSEAAQTSSTTTGRTYKVQVDSSDNLVVNVPWSDTDTNTNQLTEWTLRDDDNDDVTIGHNKFVKFVAATGTLGTNTSGSGTTASPYVVTITSPDTNTQNQYGISAADGTTASREKIVLGGSGHNGTTTDFIEIAAGTGMSIGRSGDVITLTNTSTNVDVDVSVANLETRLGEIDSDINIGDSSGPTVTITGNLVVEGTTTTVESTVTTFTDPIIELNKVAGGGTQANPTTSSGIEVKRAGIGDVQLVWMEDSDDWEFQAYDHSATPVKRKYKIPTSYKATIGDSNAAAGSYSEAVTHNLGTKHVIVQCYDTSTFETVYADVVRTSDNVVTLTFASAPTDNDVTVLILSAQGEQ